MIRSSCECVILVYKLANYEWSPGSLLPIGYRNQKTMRKATVDKSWHVLGLGYNPSISQDHIMNAAVVDFNGNMKSWLNIGLNQFRQLWTK
ncbi:hypothetical protein EJ110_NYTH38053 [Nymphaea thermarum]|nr:hypothetical protein EJ110_NYTH38053 [Nymphaea thermarum]